MTLTIKDIYLLIKRNGPSLTESDFMADFLATYCQEFNILTRSLEPYVWDASSISRLFSKDDFSARKCTFPVGKDDFEERLNIVVVKILKLYAMYINEQTLKSDLLIFFKNQHIDVYEEEATSHLLTKILFIWFKRKYEKQRKSFEKIPFAGRQSLFAMIIEGVANSTSVSSESVKIELPYTIEDKITVNSIKSPLKEDIIESFDIYYETIEWALDELSEKDINIKTKFLNRVRKYYQDYLNKNDISSNDIYSIKQHSNDAFLFCSSKIFNAVENKDMENVYEEDLYDYVTALTTYVFYKCRILMKVGKEDVD